jgi:hypothetical protein
MSALAAALLLAGTGAGAQERSPYYIGLSQAFSHDSNVFRTASNEVSETISSTGVLAGIDQPLGRQRLYGDVSAQVNRYRRSDQLDNKSYAALAGLDWQTIEFLSGTLRYSTRNSLADFGTLEGASAPSDQTTQQALASVRYGLSSRLSLDGSYEYRSLEYKSAAYANRNYSQDTVGAGVHYGTPSILVFGLAGRVTRGSTPQFQATPPFEDELKRRDIDFTVMWTPTGFSTLNLRLSATRETHTLASNSEVSAGTGAISWDYRPTAKLGFTTTLSRDTGTETTFSATAPSGSAPLRVDNNRLSTLGEIGVRYAMTSKVSMTLDARHRKGSTPTGGDDKQTGYGVGVSYNPTRSSTLACNVLQDRRDAPGSTEYTATTTSCSAQITLR